MKYSKRKQNKMNYGPGIQGPKYVMSMNGEYSA